MREKSSGLEATPGRRRGAAAALLVLLLAAVPILLVPIPPSTDLPQHLAQVRLFKEALARPGGPYVIQWLAPNNLVYFLLLGLWPLLPVGLMARAALMLVAVAWLAAVHGLGRRRDGEGRGAAVAMVASLLVFNQSFYWGFLNFLIGFPAFVLWFTLTAREPRRTTWRLWPALAGAAVLLYGGHALWFAAGAAWLIVIGLARRAPAKVTLLRLSSLVPCGLVALFWWYPRLAASRASAGFDVAAHWSPVFDRLASFLPSAFGGIRGAAGTLAFVFVLLWMGLAVWQNRRRLRQVVDPDLLLAGVLFLAVVVVAPDKYMNTIFFGSRWFPAALTFLLLALPPPSFGRAPAKAVALAAAAAFFAVTAVVWVRFERQDLSGFRESLDAVRPGSRVLGLDLVKESELIKDRPFLQLFAYAQVFKGCELNFSFAEHYSGLVAYRTRREVCWTPGLEWHGEKVKSTDFAHFDFVLVNGEERDHRAVASFSELQPMTGSGRWRAYRVRR
ncbi:MAG TPA: hypothetical protein VMS75_06430 [Terriglobales bacterium]|nr:hypothetical protein [Terriglobales bacterium]